MNEEQERAYVAAKAALDEILNDTGLSDQLNDQQWVTVEDARNILHYVLEDK